MGLLGTVWGVMDCFGAMSQQTSVTLQQLAPGVAGSLLTTVAGLLVAIPSVFGFNFLTTQIRKMGVEIENFATSLSDSCAGKIESLVLFYPVTKAYDDGSSSWNRYGSGFGLDTELMCEFNHAYVAGADPLDKRISVGDCGDDILGRLPRALLIAAGRDILCDQGEEFARKAGKRLTRIEFPGAVHLFITVPGQDKAFSTAVELASDFLL